MGTRGALKDVVAAFWHVSGDPSRIPVSSVLPDGHVELVLDLGAPVDLRGRAFTGEQPARAVVGVLSHAVRIQYRGPVDTFGVRFCAASGAGFFGQQATVLAQKILPLAEVCPALASPSGRALLAALLLEQKTRALPRDTKIARLLDRLTGARRPRQSESRAERGDHLGGPADVHGGRSEFVHWCTLFCRINRRASDFD